MTPGATTSPRASIRRLARADASAPLGAMRAMRPPDTATSPYTQALPVPSTMRPPEMIRSNAVCDVGAGDVDERPDAPVQPAAAANASSPRTRRGAGRMPAAPESLCGSAVFVAMILIVVGLSWVSPHL